AELRALPSGPRRVDDDVHAALADVVLMPPADAHRHADHPDLRVAEAAWNVRSICPFADLRPARW
ncbi:MAG: hypothetical protein M3Y29_04540, partial [Chloroflexota bacterium]|nr:hypothetical protein [Chloroflexota bacterium]